MCGQRGGVKVVGADGGGGGGAVPHISYSLNSLEWVI